MARNIKLSNETNKKRRHERRAMAIKLLGGKCVNCGATERLHFDHIKNDRNGMKGLVSRLFSYSIERLLDELEKCQLLCIDCHLQKTIIDSGNQKSDHGRLSMYIHHKCRCDECRAANTAHMKQYLQRKRATA